jgi:hypothetical protein
MNLTGTNLKNACWYTSAPQSVLWGGGCISTGTNLQLLMSNGFEIKEKLNTVKKQ